MTKYNRRTRSRRSRRKRTRRGGKYAYDLNTRPMIFTNTTTQQGGDARDTLFPSFLTNMVRDTGYQVQSLWNAGMGKYEPTNPSPLAQNLFKR